MPKSGKTVNLHRGLSGQQVSACGIAGTSPCGFGLNPETPKHPETCALSLSVAGSYILKPQTPDFTNALKSYMHPLAVARFSDQEAARQRSPSHLRLRPGGEGINCFCFEDHGRRT